MDVERSSLCNCVVNFLLEENYLLTAFELLHELIDDGRDSHAIRLKEFFSDQSLFPSHHISRFNSLRALDPQSLLEEKEAIEEKLAVTEYELRLAQEDISKLKKELENKADSSSDVLKNNSVETHRSKDEIFFSDLGPLKDVERQDINCAVKEYLLMAGYRLTTMTFYEEVIDQDLDAWEKRPSFVPDALRHYYYQFLSSTAEAAEEKISMLREIEALQKDKERLNRENDHLHEGKRLLDGQITALFKSVESLRRDIREKDNIVQNSKLLLELQRQNLNDCQAEISSLKMCVEGSRTTQISGPRETEPTQEDSFETSINKIKSTTLRTENLESSTMEPVVSLPSYFLEEDEVRQGNLDVTTVHDGEITPSKFVRNSSIIVDNEENGISVCSSNDSSVKGGESCSGQIEAKSFSATKDNNSLETIKILADALPKIVPYVLINHREELLPLLKCAIESHPDGNTRDSLTHSLFNLIKRPDEQQRRVIMDACVSLARNIGEMRTETELLPQCWEQINHVYEERRLLVAQSCSEISEFTRPEIRDSLILSIIQQLVEDSAIVVRDAASHNLALLLPLFPSSDKYFKVEEMMFQLVCDPSGVVVETTLKQLIPAIIKWGKDQDHILRVLLSHILSTVQRCPPLSGVESSVESHLRVLGERERWNIDVLLQLLAELFPFVLQKAVDTCPYPVDTTSPNVFSRSILQLYAGNYVHWPAFDWMHSDCFPDLIRLACLLPQKEDSLRKQIIKYLLAVSRDFGNHYLMHIMLPVFLIAVGDVADSSFFPPSLLSIMKGLRPTTSVSVRITWLCVLPLLLAGVLGAPVAREELTTYLRKLLRDGVKTNSEFFNAIRFLCTFEEHHSIVFSILWEMVVCAETDVKITAANCLKAIVPSVDVKVCSSHILPALVTLGSDPNLEVKFGSIDAFGAVALHFNNEMIVDKIRVQMDTFLEDGSNEAVTAVVHALVASIPHTTSRLREYLVSKMLHFSSKGEDEDVTRRERVNTFCEAIRALDATETSGSSGLITVIHNLLLKDTDSLDPAHREALENIVKERDRSGGGGGVMGKVMGAHLGISSSVSTLFGEGRLLGKRETVDPPPEPVATPTAAHDTPLRRMIRGGFTEILKRQQQ